MTSWLRERSAVRVCMPTSVCAAVLTVVCGWAQAGTPATRPTTLPAGNFKEEESLYDCPQWAREKLPDWVTPFLGRYGLPEPYPHQKTLIGDPTAGIDLWQANHFIAYREETARYLYEDYTPTTVDYQPGTLPSYEAVVARYTKSLTNPREKAVVLCTRAMLDLVQHPGIPPMCVDPGKNRALDDEALLKSRRGWCNEQARVFVRLCQVAGVPARMIFLFQTPVGGHVVAEFYADGRWSMADSSWFCVFPAADGHLMSAAECHGEGKLQAGETYFRRYQEIIAYSDERMVGDKFPAGPDAEARRKRVADSAEGTRKDYRAETPRTLANRFWAFGVLNYPLPR